MICSYEVVYEKGSNAENEDAYVVNEGEGIFSVIDGATGLGGISGKLAAEIVKKHLESPLENESLLDTMHRSNEAIGDTSARLVNLSSIRHISKENRSSCGIAAIKLGAQSMSFVHGGDCMIFIEFKNGEIHQLTYDHLAKLDSISIELMKNAIEEGLANIGDNEELPNEMLAKTLAKARKIILPTIIENRRKLNTTEGYGVLDGSPEAIQYLATGTIPLHDASRILLLTDGLQLPEEKASGQKIWKKTADYAFKFGLEKLKSTVIETEMSDRSCIQFPRLKFSDDKTGIMLILNS